MDWESILGKIGCIGVKSVGLLEMISLKRPFIYRGVTKSFSYAKSLVYKMSQKDPIEETLENLEHAAESRQLLLSRTDKNITIKTMKVTNKKNSCCSQLTNIPE